MVCHKEYRVCMPVSVEEYRVGQLFMIAKHCHEQSDRGDGVEVIKNEACQDEKWGHGQYTEKRIHVSSKLPSWARPLVSRYLYVEEKAWNYFPYTITEYSCSFVPSFTVRVETCYEDNAGTSENALSLSDETLEQREVQHIDIAHDDIDPRKYKEEEDCRLFKSEKTGRGPLTDKNWRETTSPLMCSYKLVSATCHIWGVGGYMESAVQTTIRDILLHGHRQAVCWMDEWIGMTMEDVREYELCKQQETNVKTLGHDQSADELAGT